jgi:hypothetical protein
MIKLLGALGIPITALLSCAVAHGDVGNAGPGPTPGLCEYPAVCGSGMIGVGVTAAYWYWEDFPIELNGSHRHCQWGGAATATSASVGFSMIWQVQAGISAPVGALTGGCGYVCPDMQQAMMPNPPGGWKDAIRPTKCQAIGPNPFAPPPPPQDVPIAPPITEQGAVPPPEIVPNGPPPADVLPSVTNPACPNPDATTTSSCGAG